VFVTKQPSMLRLACAAMPAHPIPPIDPDVGPRDRQDAALLLVVAAGGIVGAEARYGLGGLIDRPPTAYPRATSLINVSGCLLIGVLMATLAVVGAHRLVRPFLGVGVLGGYTTFSTFAVDVDQLLHAQRWGVALGYLVSTAALAALAVCAGWSLTARVLR
jgi:CrcB protein